MVKYLDNYEDKSLVDCKIIQNLFPLIKSVAPTDMPVLIIGEYGTRKSLIAKMIHNDSERKCGKLITVDCKNPDINALEIELFGQEQNIRNQRKIQEIGKLEQAYGGSILLNEVGSIPNIIQARLLKVIQDQEIYRVGGTTAISINVRVLATTTEDLECAVNEGRFRKDLFYRLAVFPIFIYPLRTSPDDIKLLANNFLKIIVNETNKMITGISNEAMKLLVDYNWPGNIRELEEVMEYAVKIEQSYKLRPESLPDKVRFFYKIDTVFQFVDSEDMILPLEEIEKQALIQAMKITGNNVLMMAKALGINRATVYRKLEKYNLLIKQ